MSLESDARALVAHYSDMKAVRASLLEKHGSSPSIRRLAAMRGVWLRAQKAAEIERAMLSTRHLAYRVRILPEQLDGARRKVAALENEARRYGMTDLLEQRA